MERYSRIHFRKVGYETLIKEGWTPDQIAASDLNSIKTEVLLDSACNIRSVGIRTDSNWLENIGRHALGFDLVDSTSWQVSMRGL